MKDIYEIKKNGEDTWYLKNNIIHRDNDLPAVIIRDGKKQIWFKNGLKHRLGKPAIISQAFSYDLSYEEWWIEGQKHREDGPAVTFSSGNKEYWLNGVEITEKDFLHELEKFKLNKKLDEDLKQSPKKRKIKL